MISFNSSVADLRFQCITLGGFFNGIKTASRFRPFNDMKILGLYLVLYLLYAEIFGSDSQGFTETF